MFQSTPPHGGRHFTLTCTVSLYPVSIHAPAWGATFDTFDMSKPTKFQSTPPHGGRLSEIAEHTPWSVSIHAPAWGATSNIIRS